jgi:hypothetical protein
VVSKTVKNQTKMKSVKTNITKVTTQVLREMKIHGEKIAMLTTIFQWQK